MTLHQIEKDVFLGSPFVHKFKPDYYPGIINAALNNPHLFDDITRLKTEILKKEKMDSIPENLNDYYGLINTNMDNDKQYDSKEVADVLSDVEKFRYFFKEMGASLKFNPLSRSRSAIHIRERANTLIHKFGRLIKPKALLIYVNVSIDNSHLFIQGTDFYFASKKLSTYFSESDKNNSTQTKNRTLKRMVLYVVTIGPGIDDTVKELGKEGEMFDSYILNGIGAAAAEMVAEDLNNYLNNNLTGVSSGLRYQRFSPGYGDWLVNDQEKIFKILKPEKRIGVILNEGHIMLPEKSTSGIMGLKTFDNKSNFHSGAE